jgi:hypothetical protein
MNTKELTIVCICKEGNHYLIIVTTGNRKLFYPRYRKHFSRICIDAGWIIRSIEQATGRTGTGDLRKEGVII